MEGVRLRHCFHPVYDPSFHRIKDGYKKVCETRDAAYVDENAFNVQVQDIRVSIEQLKALSEKLQDRYLVHHKGWDRLNSSPYKRKCTIDDFSILSILGSGTWGKVSLVQRKEMKENKLFAIKALSKNHLIDSKGVARAFCERNILASLSHTFIVKMHAAFQSEDSLFLVLEYCAGGDLFSHLASCQCFNEQIARFYVAEIILALEYLHGQGILYRDVKPENILLDACGHIKLSDFGLAKIGVFDSNKGASTICGTPNYMSPEVIRGQQYGLSVDWWSLGIAMYDMLVGYPPWFYPNEEIEVTFRGIKFEPLRFSARLNLSRKVKNLMLLLLQKKSHNRLGNDGAEEVKAHPFFQKIDWQDLEAKKITPPIQIDQIQHSEVEEKIKDALTMNIKHTSASNTPAPMFNAIGFSYCSSPDAWWQADPEMHSLK